MKGGLALLALLLSACSDGARSEGVASTSAAPPAAPPTAPGGRFTPALRSHDFGLVDDTRVLRFEFPFENTGTGTLVLGELKTSCGCTTTALPRTSFAPGAKEAITVEWKPKGKGVQTQTVDVFVEGARDPVRLVVRARIEPRLLVDPSLADFGDVPTGTLRSLPLTLTSDDPELEVVSVRPKVAATLVADFVPGRDGSRVGTLNVQLLPRSVRGPFGTALTVRSRVHDGESGERYEYEMEIQVRATIFGAVLVEPSAFYVGKVSPGGEVDYRVRLRRPDGGAFGLKRAVLVECTIPGLELGTERGGDGEGSFVELRLAGGVGEYVGPLRGEVEVWTDVPGDSVMGLGVMGVVRE